MRLNAKRDEFEMFLKFVSDGARDGTRTHDLLITNQLRYQLRHSSGYSFVMRRGADRRGLPNDYIISCGIFQVIFPDF